MTLLLAIETATHVAGVALADDDGVIASVDIARGRRHVETLAPSIEFLLAQAQLKMSSIDAIAVDIGPGLFTGLRVGASTAVGLGLALDRPVIPVVSLDVLAHATKGRVAAVIDARRGEVYSALYEDGVRVEEPWVGSPGAVAKRIAGAGAGSVLGDGAQRYPAAFAAFDIVHVHPTPTGVANTARRADAIAADLIHVLYLRAPDAQINWATR